MDTKGSFFTYVGYMCKCFYNLSDANTTKHREKQQTRPCSSLMLGPELAGRAFAFETLGSTFITDYG